MLATYQHISVTYTDAQSKDPFGGKSNWEEAAIQGYTTHIVLVLPDPIKAADMQHFSTVSGWDVKDSA